MSRRIFPSFVDRRPWSEGENSATVGERLRFIPHQGKQILLIDASNCSAGEVEKIFRAVPDVVMTRPKGSVLILSDVTGASFDPEATRVMKETAVFDKPYVKKSAWTGKAKVPPKFAEDLVENMSKFARREFPVFESREEALAWLVKD
jgi:hypothetical protein